MESMSYFDLEEEYKRDTIKLKVVKIIANIMANKKTKTQLFSRRDYYTYNDKEYYFTNDLGQYDDTINGRYNKEAFFNSLNDMEAFLNELKELDITNYNKKIHYKIDMIMINIKGKSPTELRIEPLIDKYGDSTFNPIIGVKRHKLYDAVYDAVLEDVKKEQNERAFIRRKVVDIISDIIDESKQKIDKKGRVYYEYNDEKYYFTNNKGEYDDSKIIADIKKDENGKVYCEYNNKIYYFTNNKGEYDDSKKDITDRFFASLKNLNKNEINMYDFSKDTSDEIDWQIGVIQALSPTQLGENNIRHTLYDAVLEDVKKERNEQNEQKSKKAANGGKRISKGKSNKVAKKPVVSQKKQSVYKEIFGKQMKIYKMPDSRKEYVKYKGELHPISEYKSLMKQKTMAKPKPKAKAKK